MSSAGIFIAEANYGSLPTQLPVKSNWTEGHIYQYFQPKGILSKFHKKYKVFKMEKLYDVVDLLSSTLVSYSRLIKTGT